MSSFLLYSLGEDLQNFGNQVKMIEADKRG